MRRLHLLSVLLLVNACVFGPGGDGTESDAGANSEQNNAEPGVLVDCADCDVDLLIGTPESKSGEKRICPTDAQFAGGVAAWDNDLGVRAAAVRCIDSTLLWDGESFVLRREGDAREWEVVGLMGDTDLSPSGCDNGFMAGVEVQMRDSVVSTLRAVCADFEFQVFEREDGDRYTEADRVLLDPAPVVPPDQCNDGACTAPALFLCPENAVAIGIAASRNFDGDLLDGFEVICSTLSMRLR